MPLTYAICGKSYKKKLWVDFWPKNQGGGYPTGKINFLRPKSAVGFFLFDAGNDFFVPEVEVCPLAFTST